jgi:hypothetical protein
VSLRRFQGRRGPVIGAAAATAAGAVGMTLGPASARSEPAAHEFTSRTSGGKAAVGGVKG